MTQPTLFDFLPPPAEAPLKARLEAIRAELRAEYLEPHGFPWIVGFSGGKDSTLVAHLVFDLLLSLAPDERRRAVHIVANDTLVESPAVMAHIASVQAEMRHAAEAWRLPVRVVTTRPDPDATFWVNLIGRGYPTPNRSFRWCTDRMKIQPTSRYIRDQVAASGEVILLLGVRRDESATRAGSVARYDNGRRLNRHNDLKGCLVFRPIVELSTDDVWEFLATNPPPWGGSHRALIQLYRDAGGGECPVVTSLDDAPSCGTTSPRFGCWTCTVVEKDRSLEGFVEAGFAEFAPLIAFRDWLASIRNDPNRRLARRRDGRMTVAANGTFIPGPFTLATRAEILDRLLALQAQVGRELISADEIARIRRIWAEDALQAAGLEIAATS
ncbi:MAG: DNA phosphorothioation system sulfurtransferase DndC [Acetobacteraceae bacterium]|nr:DNA phosphorothioation system sulfurtransferase DndC [Acetobacteraceae bacterium]